MFDVNNDGLFTEESMLQVLQDACNVLDDKLLRDAFDMLATDLHQLDNEPSIDVKLFLLRLFVTKKL